MSRDHHERDRGMVSQAGLEAQHGGWSQLDILQKHRHLFDFQARKGIVLCIDDGDGA